MASAVFPAVQQLKAGSPLAGPPKEMFTEVPEVSSSSASRRPSKPEALEPLVQALLDSSQDRDACLAACTALEAATARSHSLHRQVIAADGVEALIAAMAAHRGVSEIQLVACLALQHLAAAASCNGAARVAQAGGCEALLLAMAHDAQDPLLAQAAAHALELVAFGGPVPRQRAVDDGAVEALLSVMKVHRAASELQHAALASLQTIVERNPDCQQAERLVAADGIQRITTVLGEHKGDQQVQYWGRLLLHDMCTHNRDLRADALRKLHYQGIELEL